ncbi:MAG: hypothetical protein FJ119_07990 [Deltaproteobacteria bacterium]|nr:hypothetical protein [Deltaproteobacteria bacterium]
MPKSTFEIAVNDLRKSLPDVAWNAADDSFFAVWAAAPGMESDSADYSIAGGRISSDGKLIGGPVDILTTEDILMLPRVVYNPNKNQFLVIYCRAESYFNIRGIILDANGRPVGDHFIVTDVPANQFHYTAAFNSRRNQYLIAYNDFRDEVSSVYGVIIDDAGAVIRPEFLLCSARGHQVNPVVCYNPTDDTYLINWEDFRAHGNSLESLGTLEVMTDIYGALLAGDGTIMVSDIPMCADAEGANADQRFNGIAWNRKKNEFLTSWTDTRNSIKNVAVVGRIVKAGGSMPEGDFPLVDAPGAQMISHTHYVPEADAFFIAFERDLHDVDKFYFKDIKAKLDIGACWLDGSGRPAGDIIDIFSGPGNQRFVRFAHSEKSGSFLLVWQSDFSGVSDSVEGHIMSAGGNIMGAMYKK